MNWIRSLSGRLSITARIAVGSLIIAVLVGVVAVVGIRLGVNAILNNATLTVLRHDAEPFEEQLQRHATDIDAAPGDGQYVALISPAGDVRISSLPKSLRPYGKAPREETETITRVKTPKTEYIVRVAPVETAAGVWYVVTARNEDANQLVLDKLSAALIVGAVILVGCFTLASYILARTALRPVNVMRRQADAISRRQTDGYLRDGGERASMAARPPGGHPRPMRWRRTGSDAAAGADVARGADASGELLEVPPVRDELAALAVTLNGLIEALRASADREKQLVSDASHELRTPLAVLRGELELAELDSGDADALLDDIRQAQQTVLRLSTLATNLLELSRIDAHGTRGSSSWSELEDELAAAIDRMRQASVVQGVDCVIDFEVSAESTDHGTIAMSTQDFGRIVDNLIANAIKAVGSDRGAGTITARLSRDDAAVRLTIVDDGPGMPPDFVPIALDRFTRVDEARNTTTGSGLGLAIVAGLVHTAAGDIRLFPSAGGGLTVELTLPVTVAPGDDPEASDALGVPDEAAASDEAASPGELPTTEAPPAAGGLTAHDASAAGEALAPPNDTVE
ncbi:sensor histidine kinase [Rathayibacter sp. CAU 1779]